MVAQGGFLIGAVIVIAVWMALGASAVVAVMAEGRERVLYPVASVGLAAVVLVPAVVTHRPHANHRAPAFADQYARNVLGPLPVGSVLLVWGTERTFPLVYSQVVHGLRADVSVIAGDGLSRPWYR